MSIFDTEYYHNFKKLPEMNVYYIHFQTIRWGHQAGFFFQINAHECEIHRIFLFTQ